MATVARGYYQLPTTTGHQDLPAHLAGIWSRCRELARRVNQDFAKEKQRLTIGPWQVAKSV